MLILIMTLNFTSFSIKDILTGRDVPGLAGEVSPGQHCAPQNLCEAYSSNTTARDVSHRLYNEEPRRRCADPSLSMRNLRTDSYDGDRSEETARTEGERQIIIISFMLLNYLL